MSTLKLLLTLISLCAGAAGVLWLVTTTVPGFYAQAALGAIGVLAWGGIVDAVAMKGGVR